MYYFHNLSMHVFYSYYAKDSHYVLYVLGIEICVLRSVDEERFVETWMAYSLTHLDGASPTVDAVSQMERKEFLKKELGTLTPSVQPTTPLVVYNKTQSTQYPLHKM